MTLREWLFYQRISVTDFAERLGISRHHLNRIVNGWYVPSRKLAKKIELATEGKVSTNELLYPEENKEGEKRYG